MRVAIVLCLLAAACAGATKNPLAVGTAGHAFDHLGDMGEQARAAADSGANIIYATGFGALGYQGLPVPHVIEEAARRFSAYNRDAKANGIRLSVGYVCATSIVKLETFDANWTSEFGKQFSSPPADWLQRDRDGKPLASWYGGDYHPACMSNPDWRTYEKHIVRLQLESGHDGIFFDNPTVHPQGCYCRHCMTKFAKFVGEANIDHAAAIKLAADRPKDFLRFRGMIAADFLAEVRTFARSLQADAIITCNNSLNSPDVLYSQCRTYGYNVFELSKAEDLVVVEDMTTQPRVLTDGTIIEYGPVYEVLHAISHGKPIVAVALADADYHTPPNLVRLAMAEAAAHQASHLWWPTWPQDVRQRMIDTIRPQAEFLREHAELLNDTTPRADVTLHLPFEQWVETDHCAVLQTARELSRANVQFKVVCGSDEAALKVPEDRVVRVQGPPTLRAVVREKEGKQMVHLLNLNIARISSFEDHVTPAENVQIDLRCADSPKRITALSADQSATRGELNFTTAHGRVNVTVGRIDIATILLIE